MTLSTRNLQAVKANLKQYDKGVRERAKVVVLESLERTFAIAQSLAPRETHYMAEHMRAELTLHGFGYEVGYEQSDFVGRLNPVSGVRITEFYPLFQEFGTMLQPGTPHIFPARDQERPRFRRELARAMKVRR
jgi:hypothetical protein